MKRLYWVSDLLIILIIGAALISCSSISDSDRNEVVSTAIKLADRYCTLNEYDKALDVYRRANEKCPDWRFDYNTAVIQDFRGDNSQAIETALGAYRKYGKSELLSLARKIATKTEDYRKVTEIIYLQIELDPSVSQNYIDLISNTLRYDSDEAYRLVEEYWNKGNHNLATAELLYKLNPDRWVNVYKALGGTVVEKEPDIIPAVAELTTPTDFTSPTDLEVKQI